MSIDEQTALVAHWSCPVDTPFRPVAEIVETSLEGPRPNTGTSSWANTADQIAFRERVLQLHVATARATKKRGPGRDLARSELELVPGTNIEMRADAAQAAGRLIAAANQALAQAQQTGDPDAANTRQMGAKSGYRSSTHQATVWRDYFPGYYNRTIDQRAGLPDGPHGPSGAQYMITGFRIPRWIAAPGYSNHQAGIAIDLTQTQVGRRIKNSSLPAQLRAWRNSWLYQWLHRNAAFHGFQPYQREPWHWEYRPGESVRFIPEATEDLVTCEGDALTEDLEDEGERVDWLESDIGQPATEDHHDSDRLDEEDSRYKGESDQLYEEWSEFEQSEMEPEADPELADIAERIAAGMPAEADWELEFEDEKPRRRPPYRFTDADIERIRQAYQDNIRAAAANERDRAACIVMLNVGIGRLLRLKTRPWPARRDSSRRVPMPALTTETIELAMAQLRRQNLAGPPVEICFLGHRGHAAGVFAPQRMVGSVAARASNLSGTKPGWYAFGLSIMDGYHSVLLLTRRTNTSTQLFWLDQYSTDVTDDVTTTLDDRITKRTKQWWQAIWIKRKVGYSTTARLWPLLGRAHP